MPTTILANIYKNGDASKPLAGYISVKSQSIIVDGSLLFVADPVQYPLVNGSVSFDLAPTEVARVSYTFEIWETNPASAAVKLYGFDAVVPISIQPININVLAQQSGLRYDQQDASLLTLAKYILNSDLFQNRLLDKLLNMRGDFDLSRVYRRGDAVLYAGDGYLYVSDIATAGNYPSNPAYWKKYVSKGGTGSGTVGDDSVYGVAWAGSTTTPTRNSVYAKMETMLPKADAAALYAPLDSPVLKSATQDPSTLLTANDNSRRLADTAWVQNLVRPCFDQMPIGARIRWDNTTALPVKTLRANGQAISRTTYSALYALWGTVYGTGDGSTTFNVPIDSGFIIYTGIQ